MNECPNVAASLREVWTARVRCDSLDERRARVTLPLHYPDGDLLEVLVSKTGTNSYLVSDFGQVAARLSSVGVAIEGEAHQNRVRQICRPLRVLAIDHELLGDVADEYLGDAIFDLASAMMQVDALSVLRRQGTPSFALELTEWLESVPDLTVKKKPTATGVSGKRYQLTASVSGQKVGSAMIQAVSSAAANRSTRSIDHAFRIFYDLAANEFDPESNIVVLAEPANTYDPADLKLFEGTAVVADWHSRSRLKAYLLNPEGPVERLT